MNKTKKILQQLGDYESRNVTYVETDGSWPIVWERARGSSVWDAEGKKYLDLTAAFGVAAAGHANPRVIRAGQYQMEKLMHAMGDVHPHALKAELARELSRITYERWSVLHPGQKKKTSGANRKKVETGKTVFCSSGFEAVEAALKTTALATSKTGIIAFEGAYHGLGYGALNATHREHFRGPFLAQLGGFAEFVAYPAEQAQLKRIATEIKELMRHKEIGAVLVEPVQARGGINVPPVGFLKLLRRLCDEHGALLIVDEIYTGFGRTGKWFACEHGGVTPDVICLGKAMAGGFPISACVGRAQVMDAAWPVSSGEAIHTSTFLGHPVGCAMALEQIAEIRRERLVERSAQLGQFLLHELNRVVSNRQFDISIRGLGLMAGVELCLRGRVPATLAVLRVVKELLRRGYIVLPEGAHGNVISFTPPLTITRNELRNAVRVIGDILQQK